MRFSLNSFVPTDLSSSPAKKRKRDDVRVHTTGSARTEGYYKMDIKEKMKYKVRVRIYTLLLSFQRCFLIHTFN